MDSKKLIIWGGVALLAIIAAVALFLPKGGGAGSGAAGGLPASGDISNEQLVKLAAQGATLVDVRTPAEFEGGHIEGAINAPVDDIQTASASWDKATPVIVYCATGSRSANAAGYLTAQGFSNVYDLPGGVAAWDGELVAGASKPAPAAAAPSTGEPTMYAFMSTG